MLDETCTAYLNAIRDNNHDETQRLERLLNTVDELDRQRPVNLGTAARDYAAAGIAVFPIQPTGKRPLTGHGFKDATTESDQIGDWWQQWPDANIGLPTGLSFDVIDIDGRDGIATMYSGDRALIDTVTVLGVALTSRDAGRHLYVPVSGEGNKTAIYPGVDYRGAGGYVVAPPSVGVNGRRYQWIRPLERMQAKAAA